MKEGAAEGCRKFASATRYKMLLLLATSALFIYLFVYYLSLVYNITFLVVILVFHMYNDSAFLCLTMRSPH